MDGIIKTIQQQLQEVGENICDNFYKYRDSADEDMICDGIRKYGACPLDKLT